MPNLDITQVLNCALQLAVEQLVELHDVLRYTDRAPFVAFAQGFAIGSAALVSLALFGAYVTRAKITVADSSILDPEVRI